MKEAILKVIFLLAYCWAGTTMAAELRYSTSGETAAVEAPAYANEYYTGDIVIPETIIKSGKTYRVTKINTSAFAGQKITSIVVGDYVETIAASAFANCKSLAKVTLGNAVRSCGSNAFNGCTALRYFNIKNLELWCGIGFVTGNPITQTGDLYYNGHLLTDLVIPSSVQEIAPSAFRGCTSLQSIVIPETVTAIGQSAFDGCANVTSIKVLSKQISIPRNYKSGSPSRFYGCGVKTAGPIGSGCDFEFAWDTSMPNYALMGLTNLEKVTLPKTTKSIPYGCFWLCNALKHITIGSGVNSIEEDAFLNCDALKTAIVLSEECVWLEAFPSATTIYVSDPKHYTAQNSWQLKAFCSIPTTSYEYSGKAPTLQVTNNMTSDFPYLFATAETGTLQKNAGTYTTSIPVHFTGSEDFTVNVPCTYTITRAPLTFTVNDAQREFGDGNPTFTYSVAGFKNGEGVSVLNSLIIGTEAATTSNAGTYSITIAASAHNYDIICHSGTLTINKAPLTVGVNDCQKTYGDPNPTFTCYYEGLKLGEGAPTMTQAISVQTQATKTSAVGRYSLTPSGGISNNYYIAQYTKGYLTINKANLKVKAIDVSRLYYEQNPELPLSYTGFRNSDNENNLTVIPTATTKATKTSNAGSYAINVGEGQSNNYNISYEQGTLIVKKRTLTAKARSYTRKYNEPNPVFEIDYSGFVGGEDQRVILAPLTINCEATRKTDVGAYGIYLSAGEADNYTFNYVPGTLTIQKAEQTLTWDDYSAEANIGDQIALLAEVDSGEEITYTCDDESIASLYNVGSTWFLDCRKAGTVYIRAQQEGTKNYMPSNRIAKKLVIFDPDVTTAIMKDVPERKNTELFTPDGRRISKMQNGINIKRTEDGKTVKVLKK